MAKESRLQILNLNDGPKRWRILSPIMANLLGEYHILIFTLSTTCFRGLTFYCFSAEEMTAILARKK